MFLENGGFNYILDSFKSKKITSEAAITLNDHFVLKNLSFMLTLLRAFMTAAFTTADKNID